MMRIRTGSRLHFGLLAPAATRGRRFGGVGMMVEAPGIEITAEPASAWSVEGQLTDRAQSCVDQLVAAVPEAAARPLAIHIRQAAREHVGYGTGTQLSLAIARLLAEACPWEGRAAPALARLVGRGARSALGIHGFSEGGFLVEGGKRADAEIAPLVVRHPFPEAWRILLVTPTEALGLHGSTERQAFAELDAAEFAGDERLCRLTLMGLLPALVERRFAEFSESLYQLNRVAGELFHGAQGGAYAPAAAAFIEEVRALGVDGVGQSSWGPAVFAVCPDVEKARWLASNLAQKVTARTLPPADLLLTQGRNRGATVENST